MKNPRTTGKAGRSEPKTAANKGSEMPRSLLFDIKEVVQLVGLSRVTLWRMWNTGEFPKPVEMPVRVTRFRREDVEAWVAGGCRRVSRNRNPKKSA